MSEHYPQPKVKFFGRHTIFRDGDPSNPYMKRLWIGRLRLHVFYRGDQDEDAHDHPWDFWTFPLRPYVEEVRLPIVSADTGEVLFVKTIHIVVPAFRISKRPATHIHRVLGPYLGVCSNHNPKSPLMSLPATVEHANYLATFKGWIPQVDTENTRLITIVWRSKFKRQWGFWKSRLGRWCWQRYDDYFNGGRNAPCQD